MTSAVKGQEPVFDFSQFKLIKGLGDFAVVLFKSGIFITAAQE